MNRILILLLFALFSVVTLNAQETVAQVKVTNTTVSIIPGNEQENVSVSAHHFYYQLPKTIFKVEVTLQKVTNHKGIFADYAQKLLGINNYIETNNTQYALQKVSVTENVIPDNDLCFLVNLSETQIENNFLSTLLQQDNGLDAPHNATFEAREEKEIPSFFKNYYDKTYTQQENSYIDTRVVRGVVTQVPVSQVKIVSKSTEDQAQEAVDVITKARKDKYAILIASQEVPYSAEALEFMVKELEELENHYLQLFTGYSLTESETFTFYITPRAGEVAAFSVNPQQGFSKAISNAQAYNYSIKFEPLTPTTFWKEVNAHNNNSVESTKSKKQEPRSGYRVRQPLPANVALMNSGKEITRFGTYPIFQFGEVTTLPTGLDSFDISKWSYIKF